MDAGIYNMYLLGENQLRHQEMLQIFSANDYPKMKPDDRKSLHRSISKIAHPENFNNVKDVVLLSDVANRLGF